MLRIHISGPHANRSPLSYAALTSLFQERIERVEKVEGADLYVFAHILDIQQAPEALIRAWRQRRRPVVLLSEEPFWDTIWGKQPLQRDLLVETDFGLLPVVQLNHATSDIFDFDCIPYYLLTNHRFANAYMARFVRNAARTAAEWQQAFANRSVDLTFMFERRAASYHAVTWPEADIMGLCSWRTELAEQPFTGRIERLGQSWQGGATRLQLRNWHLDKLVRLDGHARVLAAFENTHQPTYVTEKIFDAFACGSVPLYVASPAHRLHDFALPPEAWVNLYGRNQEECRADIETLIFDLATGQAKARLEAFVEAQQHLARLFCDAGLWVAERQQLANRVVAALETVLEEAADAA